jgi:hypothetical protein
MLDTLERRICVRGQEINLINIQDLAIFLKYLDVCYNILSKVKENLLYVILLINKTEVDKIPCE